MDEGLSKKRGAHISGRLKNYMRWPIAMAIMLLLLNLWIYCIDIKAGTLMLIFMLIYIVGIGILYVYSRSLIMKDLIEFAAQYGVVQNTLLKELSVPYAILLEDGQLLWMNDQFERLFGDTAQKDKYLSRYIPELNRSIFPKEENDVVEASDGSKYLIEKALGDGFNVREWGDYVNVKWFRSFDDAESYYNDLNGWND